MELDEAIEKGDVKIFMLGEKIKGAYALVRTGPPGDREKWLLIKKRDEGADARRRPTSSQPESVLSGRTIEQVLEEEAEPGQFLQAPGTPAVRAGASLGHGHRGRGTDASELRRRLLRRRDGRLDSRGSRSRDRRAGRPGPALRAPRTSTRPSAPRGRPSPPGARCRRRRGPATCWRCATRWSGIATSSPRWSPPTWARPWPTPTARSAAASSRSSRPPRIPHLLKGETLEGVASGIDVELVRQPVGVVAAITPFNFPAMIPLWFLPYAVACGNAFILKPSERDPRPSQRICELIAEEEIFPPGVVNLVHGGREAVESILDHEASTRSPSSARPAPPG